MIKKLKFSVITICLNAESFIEATIRSVLDQTHKDIEYIIVDGGSTDKTLHILEKYRNSIAELISEPDDGIYDAMNKGIQRAKGNILCFMNAGDLFSSERIFEIVNNLFENIDSTPDIVYGDVILSSKGEYTKVSSFRSSNIEFVWYGPICHQSIFARRELFSKGFSLNFRVCADFDWFLHAIIRENKKIMYIPEPLSIYQLGGFSAKNIYFYEKESSYITLKYFFYSLILGQVKEHIQLYKKNGMIHIITRLGYLFNKCVNY